MKITKITRITAFTIFALAWSYTYFVLCPFKDLFEVLPYPIYILIGLFPAIGTALVGKFLRQRMDKQPEYSLYGTNKNFSKIVAGLPIVFLASTGVPNSYGFQENLFGLFLGFVVLAYALLEEQGWRGYLQEEISDKLGWKKFAIIATVWYAWHWSFLGAAANFDLVKIISEWILFFGATAGIGLAVKQTKSVLVGAAFHSLGNILVTFSLVANSIPVISKVILIVVFILLWKNLEKRWNGAEKEIVPQLD